MEVDTACFEPIKTETVLNYMKYLFVSILFLALNAFGQTTNSTVTIEPYKSLSYGAFFKSLTIHSEDTHAEYIDGLDFEWGYIYELKIKSVKLKNPPMDAGDTEYSLIQEISKTKAPEDYQFNLRLENEVNLGGESASALDKVSNNEYIYLKEITIIIPETLEESFQEVLAGKSKIGTFMFKDQSSIELIQLK